MSEEKRIPTTERLAVVLETAGAPLDMIQAARNGHYDDYKSDVALPQHELIIDLHKAHLDDLIPRVTDGEFSAEKWEADEWAASEEGQEIFREFMK